MQRRSSLFIAATLVAFAFIGCNEQPPAIQKIEKIEPQFRHEGMLQILDSNDQQISALEIEFADDQYERTQGMMWRKQMLEDRGMLFLFDRAEQHSFWMRNCYVSLDMIFVNSDLKIETIVKNTPIMSDASHPSIVPVQYVVEVNAGYCDRHGIKPGHKIAFQRLP